MSVLTLYQNDDRVGEHILKRAVVSLGRHADNDIVLDDLALSRFHARIERRGDRYVVVDLGSQNGVFLNGVRVSGEAVIRPGDRVGMGRYVGVFNQGVERRVRARSREPKAAVPRGGPWLVLMHNGNEVDRHLTKPDGVIIGRSQRCDVVIGLLALSRRHARVRQGEGGLWFVEDLGSQNGTYLNDKPVLAPTRIDDGDVLNFFEYSVVFEAADEEPGASSYEPLHEVDSPSLLLDSTVELRQGRARKTAAPAEQWDRRRAVSDVIELSLDDVEELSPEFDVLPDTRSDGDSVPQTFPDSEDEPTAYRSARMMRSWPGPGDVAAALIESQKAPTSGRLEVEVDGRIMTEVPLKLGAVRIGSDARCDVALPPLPGIAAWHLLVVAIGEAVILFRIGDAPAPRIEGRVVYQAFLLPGDRVELGRAAIIYRV